MALRYDERNFEEEIEYALLNQEGYEKGTNEGFDLDYGLNPDELVGFIKDTQPAAWKQYNKIYKSNAEETLIKALDKEINKKGLIHVLRNGFSDMGVNFKIAAFQNETTLNIEVKHRYDKNRLKVIRQFRYSSKNENTIDLVIQLNGIPIVGIELKNQFTSQDYNDAKNQWKMDRDPKEKIFRFNQRFLVYFALDMNMVEYATKLDGKDTYFLPFNQGSNGAGKDGGKGNPPGESYPTEHLWKIVLRKDNLMEILHRFIHLEENEKDSSKSYIVFPRYHQFDVVSKLVEAARNEGPGKNYLVQHSAGSGKSFSIAWLAYRLSTLHNDENEPIFDSVIVITDRRILDKQLQNTIAGLDHTKGVVEKIDEEKTSQHLKKAINNEKKIIITTIQKFPVIYDELDDQSDKNFAVIIDEAHSSQTGSTAKKMKEGLGSGQVSEEEAEYLASQVNADYEDLVVDKIKKQGLQENLSMFAFTATPKNKTLQLFGKKTNESLSDSDSEYKAHHIYSMRQAIEEGFILDVLENYTTYEMAYKIIKEGEDNPELPVSRTSTEILEYQSLHEHNIEQKTEVMLKHYLDNVKHRINGKAKAMLVTSSRLHAVKYFLAFKDYIEKNNLGNELGVLVAFSGTVEYGGIDYTEANMNKRRDGSKVTEGQLPEAFKTDEFNILIVANKYQTGFDEPLLQTMYVDKYLSGVNAVQTLSRLNRTHPDKKDTFILDFVNSAEDIQEAFEPYYKETKLDRGTDPNILNEQWQDIIEFGLFNRQDVEDFSELYFGEQRENKFQQGRLTSKLQPIIENYNKLDEDKRYMVRSMLFNFIKNYSYITQFFRMDDTFLLKAYNFSEFLLRVLPQEGGPVDPIDLNDKIKMEFYKLEKTYEGSIRLGGAETLKPISTPVVGGKEDEDSDYLDKIIDKINERFSADFEEDDRVVFRGQSEPIMEEDSLRDIAMQNDLNVYKDSKFTEYFADIAAEKFLEKVQGYEKLFSDNEYYDTMLNLVAETTYNYFRNEYL